MPSGDSATTLRSPPWAGPSLTSGLRPVSLWANGWVSSLSASALLALLVLFDQRNEQPSDEPFRVPRILQSQYTLGPDVWQGGLKALTDEGIFERVPDGHRGTVPHYRYRMHLDVIAGKVRCPQA